MVVSSASYASRSLANCSKDARFRIGVRFSASRMNSPPGSQDIYHRVTIIVALLLIQVKALNKLKAESAGRAAGLKTGSKFNIIKCNTGNWGLLLKVVMLSCSESMLDRSISRNY